MECFWAIYLIIGMCIFGLFMGIGQDIPEFRKMSPLKQVLGGLLLVVAWPVSLGILAWNVLKVMQKEVDDAKNK